MKFALVDNIKTKAKRGVEAVCPQCLNKVIPKCGSLVIHHWAHEANDCDPWWEPETEWHREWKSLLPDEQIEVSCAGHRADIVRIDGLIVEIQHSPISVSNIKIRETVYKSMAWLFDGRDLFNKNIELRYRGSHHTFRWKHPRKTYGVCHKPVFIDFGDDIFWMKKLHLSNGPPYGGWGYLLPRRKFIAWLTTNDINTRSLE